MNGYTIRLRSADSGETRDFVDDCEYSDDAIVFMYSEGNYSCDCNRSLFFYAWLDALDCNAGPNKIQVLSITRPDGTELDLPDDINE